ncbi:MAG: pallilysin-related adhesin [Treponema sp.]|jgi:hypothetical protein|nr:pallilysin-related adhesin [Treponema sp.]
MIKNSLGIFIGVIIAAVILIIILATGLWKHILYPKTDTHSGPIIITPGELAAINISSQPGQILRDESLSTKIPMQDGETVIAVFNRDSEDGIPEEQFVAYTSASPDRRINIAYLSYDMAENQYKRRWNESTSATRAETITMFSQDLIGDRNNCIIVTGMNAKNEHTMTILKRRPSQAANEPFQKIAEIQIDGSIIIQEITRSVAYQQGITTGASFNIAAYGQDNLSNNLLDQIEIIYSFNTGSGVYEQTRVSRIPGSQIEQRRLRELLSGAPGVFENYINDLWYFVSPEGTVDSRQYISFDPSSKEIVFFGDGALQIFHWQSSTPTRYGLYIRSQNISITTLLRFIDIELVSLDSIKLRVVEDVRLRIVANTSWDGAYRRIRIAIQQDTVPSVRPSINTQYDSTWGRIQFFASGEYTITSGSFANTAVKKGHYVFFKAENHELLEMRPEEGSNNRMIYRVDNTGSRISLARVRLGTNGVQDLFETPVILTPVEN